MTTSEHRVYREINPRRRRVLYSSKADSMIGRLESPDWEVDGGVLHCENLASQFNVGALDRGHVASSE